MSIRLYRFLQAFILLALVVFIGFKLISGTLSLYINMQYMPLTVFGIIMLAIMTFVIIRHPGLESDEHEHSDSDHQHDISPSALIILIVPLLIGVSDSGASSRRHSGFHARHECLCAFSWDLRKLASSNPQRTRAIFWIGLSSSIPPMISRLMSARSPE